MSAAVARAITAAPGVFLIALVVHLTLDALAPLLGAQDSVLVAVGNWISVLSWACGVAVTIVTGLLIRWLLGPRRDVFRPDIGLAVYVILISASHLPSWLLLRLSTDRLIPLTTRASLTAADLVWVLVMAALALWPIALMMGDRVTLRYAVQLMAPAYWRWVAAMFILALPGLAWVLISTLLHHVHQSPGERIGLVAVSTFTSTVSTFALAYIYARRVRGMSLPATGYVGYTPEPA
jgi:hypothetical protein